MVVDARVGFTVVGLIVSQLSNQAQIRARLKTFFTEPRNPLDRLR